MAGKQWEGCSQGDGQTFLATKREADKHLCKFFVVSLASYTHTHPRTLTHTYCRTHKQRNTNICRLLAA